MASSTVPSPGDAPPTGTQLATAFGGRLPPVRASLLYRASALLVLAAMVLLPVAYLCMIAAAVAGVAWYAEHAAGLFTISNGFVGVQGVLLLVVCYVAPLVAGVLLVVFMVLPLFGRSRKEPRPLWVDRREQPLLYAYIDMLCDAMRAPRPSRIDLAATATASAHIDNGLLGLVSRRLVLTIGLPLAQALDLRQFTGVIAHELGHFTQGGGMRLRYAVFRINRWFFRLGYGRTVANDLVDSVVAHDAHWSVALVGLTCQLTLWFARLILRGLALVSQALSMQLSRQSEFDADRRAAAVVGSEAVAQTLELTPYLGAASDLAVQMAQQGWATRRLPDDLVAMTAGLSASMPPAIKGAITARILSHDAGWFDTHPPLYRRVAAMKKARVAGVLRLDADARCLFRHWDELSKLATLSLYDATLGAALQPEHLVHTPTLQVKAAESATTRASGPAASPLG